jgi:hypothetical protein
VIENTDADKIKVVRAIARLKDVAEEKGLDGAVVQQIEVSQVPLEQQLKREGDKFSIKRISTHVTSYVHCRGRWVELDSLDVLPGELRENVIEVVP